MLFFLLFILLLLLLNIFVSHTGTMAGCIRYSLSDDLVSYRGGTGSTNITLICNIMHGQRVMMHGESSERTKEAKKLLEAQSSNWNSRQTIPFVSSLIHVWRDRIHLQIC